MRTLLLIYLTITITGLKYNHVLSKSHDTIYSEKCARTDSGQKISQNVRIVFWNTENLYDTYDDTTTFDDEFTSSGLKHWSYSKFLTKINLVAKTLIAIGGWEPPAITGLCEVENKFVLNKILYGTPLKTWKYRTVHHESPDVRGIDVAMIYRPDKFRLLTQKTIRIVFPFDTAYQTREILMVSGVLFDCDTLILYINHWPSRLGGYAESQPRRNWVAKVLGKSIDSILSNNPFSNIIIMGDFNDEPDGESIRSFLRRDEDSVSRVAGNLINLMLPKLHKEGTYKYQGSWTIYDQFIVSGSIFSGLNGLKAGFREVEIMKMDFLLDEDERFLGLKPNRTYLGPRYYGGFSDHLPISLQIQAERH